MRPDARLVENIQEKCRPSTVAHAYTLLESQEWVDAKETLEEVASVDEAAVTHFLSDLLMVTNILVNDYEFMTVVSGVFTSTHVRRLTFSCYQKLR